MDAKEEILLEQILEELRAQTRALHELQRRMDEMERTVSAGLDDVGRNIGSTAGRSR